MATPHALGGEAWLGIFSLTPPSRAAHNARNERAAGWRTPTQPEMWVTGKTNSPVDAKYQLLHLTAPRVSEGSSDDGRTLPVQLGGWCWGR